MYVIYMIILESAHFAYLRREKINIFMMNAAIGILKIFRR